MIITIKNVQVDLTKDVLDGLNPTFSLLNGRRFSLGNQDLSLNQTIRLVRKEVMTSPSEDLGELIAALNGMKERGYKGKEIDNECLLVSVVTKIKHYFSKKTTNRLIKSLEKYVINPQQSSIKSRAPISQNEALEKHEIIFKALNLINDNDVDKINSLLQDNVYDDEIIGKCLTWAVREGTPEMVDIFLPLIKDLNIPLTGKLNGDDVEGKTILHVSIPSEVVTSKHLSENIKKLLERGANANIPDARGLLPIHRAFRIKDSKVVNHLIDFTHDLDVKDRLGSTALCYAAFSQPDLIDKLIRNRANANIANDMNALALHVILSPPNQPCIEHVEILIENTDDINSQLNNGETPLHIAASRGFNEIVNLLLEKGADPALLDTSGKTPLQSAQSTIDKINSLNEEGRAAFTMYFAKLSLPDLQATVERLKS